MVGKPIEIAPPQTGCVEVKESRGLNRLGQPELELGKEILSESLRNLVIASQSLIQVALNPPMESKLRACVGRTQVRRM